MARYVNGLTGKKYAKITNDNERYIDMGEFSEVVADARQTGCISIICTQGCKRLKLNKELCTALEEPSCVKVLLGKDKIAIVHVEEGTPNALTILRSVEKNEQELRQLKQQLDALDNPISAVDDAAYQEIVQKFTNYMCTERSPEAAALKEAVLRDIQIGKETITVNFQHGVFIDEETKAYFNDNRKELAS